jgi:hypothetical protein
MAIFSPNKRETMKRKPKRGIDLICPKHGAEVMLIEELSPTEKHSFEIKCKGIDARKRCRHHEYASGKQVEAIIRVYRDCDAREYRPNPYDSLFERPK